MKTFAIALLVSLAIAVPAHAVQVVQRDSRAVHRAKLAQLQAMHPDTAGETGQAFAAAVQREGFGGVNGPYANPYRSYPPSCMADPLPATPTGPVYSKQIDLVSFDTGSGAYVREPVLVSVWRVPCSSSGEHDNAITLMRIQRSNAHEGDRNQYVLFPGIRVAQGAVSFGDYGGVPRVAEEPNTIVAWTPVDSALVYSTTYVLENYPLPDRPFTDYTQAFQLRLDNYAGSGQSQYVINVPAYDPDDYPMADEPLRINGYMSASYHDTDHVGELLMVQVYEVPGLGQYVLGFTWFTYNANGEPFWLTGTATVTPGLRKVTTSEVGYRTEGGFAGDFGSEAPPHLWGTMTFQWLDCNHLKFSFESKSGLPANVPAGVGTRVWTRVGNVNGLTCE